MPERWERELQRLRDVDAPEGSARARVERGPRYPGLPPRRERIVAGIVAALVAIAAAAVMVRTLPLGSRGVGDRSDDPPALSIRFHDSEVVPQGPDSSYRRVQTSISYGDASDESFTSSTPAGALVEEWAAVDALTRFVPGPTAGSAIEFVADGEDPRVLIGPPRAWPNSELFTRIERIPGTPGEYVLLFEADYPEGIARMARLVEVTRPGVLQLVAYHGEDPQAGTASAYVDGRGTAGVLHTWSSTEGDEHFGIGLEDVSFDPGSWLAVEPGSPVLFSGSPQHARAGLFETAGSFDVEARLPMELLGGASIDGPPGRSVLALDVAWAEMAPGVGEVVSTERGFFLFPIEIVEAGTTQPPSPAVEPSPSQSPIPPATETVAIEILRSGGPSSGDPAARASFGTQEVPLCPDHWTLVKADGTLAPPVLFDCGQTDDLLAPAGTSVVVGGDYASLASTAHGFGEGRGHASDVVPEAPPGSVITYTFDVAWADGSEATFRLQLTVGATEAAPAEVLRIRCGPDGAAVLTPVVAAQADGVRVQVDNPSGASALAFAGARTSDGSSFGGSITHGVRAWPIDPGAFYVECLARPGDTYRGLGTAGFEVVDPTGYWVDGSLRCAADDPPRDVHAYDGGAADYVDDEAAIRSTLGTLRSTDEVRLPFYPEGGGSKDGRYVVVREGLVVAYVFVGLSDDEDPGGSGLTEVTGKACASSGIAQPAE